MPFQMGSLKEVVLFFPIVNLITVPVIVHNSA